VPGYDLTEGEIAVTELEGREDGRLVKAVSCRTGTGEPAQGGRPECGQERAPEVRPAGAICGHLDPCGGGVHRKGTARQACRAACGDLHRAPDGQDRGEGDQALWG